MSAYVIFDIDVQDPLGYEDYRAQGAPSVWEYGGRFLVRGGAVTTLEGSLTPHRVILLEFDSLAAARRWYDSPAYTQAKAIRWRTAVSRGVMVEGLQARKVGQGDPPAQIGYVIIDVDIHDPELFAKYRELGVPTLQQFAGEVLVRSDEAIDLEGDWRPGRIVVLQFENTARARSWHASEDYQRARRVREMSATTQSFIVEGV